MWDIRHRPIKFSDVLGQEGNVQLLKSRLKNGTAFDTSYIFAGAFGRGKCISGDTLIPSSKGTVQILDLMGSRKIDPLAVKVLQENNLESTTAYSYRGGVQETVHIKTHLGLELEGTLNHRIRVLGESGCIEWRCLGDLKEGDIACIIRGGVFGEGADLSLLKSYVPLPHATNSKSFEVPSVLTPEWGRLIGYIIGDGSATSRTYISIACAEKDVKEDIVRLGCSLIGHVGRTPDKRRKSLESLRLSGIKARYFLEQIGLGYATAGGKVVPWSVMVSPKEVIREFLRAYFECDGSVSGYAIEALTKSEVLGRQLQLLLLSFGVVSRRFSKRHKKYGIYWRIRIPGPFREVFQKEIGFISRRKRQQLVDLIKQRHAKGKGVTTNIREVVPHQSTWIKSFYNNFPEELARKGARVFFANASQTGICTMSHVQKIVYEFSEYDPQGHFKSLLDSGYFFDSIESITSGKCEVFDLNVPEGEMFAANGFMNHNTTIARILARAMLCQDLDKTNPEPCNKCDNCTTILEGQPGPFVERDAASQGTIDHARAIIEELPYVLINAPKRIYLFDEAHRMSIAAQDVLLKPLEDKKMIGMFCTTEAEKIRGAIRSRCEEYTIRKVTREEILKRMRIILETEKVQYEDDAIYAVIDHSGGHIRDVINKLEMISQLGPITASNVREYLHLSVITLYYKILLSLGNPTQAIELIDQACEQVAPEEVSAGIAEAAMNTYRVVNKIHANFSLVDRGLAEQIYAKYQANVVKFAYWFLGSKYTTKISLVRDVVVFSQTPGNLPLDNPTPPVVFASVEQAQQAAKPIMVDGQAQQVAKPAVLQVVTLKESKVSSPEPVTSNDLADQTEPSETDLLVVNTPLPRMAKPKEESLQRAKSKSEIKEIKEMPPEEWCRIFEQFLKKRLDPLLRK